jgi:hypothetical protein
MTKQLKNLAPVLASTSQVQVVSIGNGPSAVRMTRRFARFTCSLTKATEVVVGA